MSDILKPCPFCGKQGHIEGSERDGFYASCRECYCCVGEAYDRDAMPSHMFQSEEAVTEAWNRRSLATQHNQGDETMEEAVCLIKDALEDAGHEVGGTFCRNIATSIFALAQQPLSVPEPFGYVITIPYRDNVQIFLKDRKQAHMMACAEEDTVDAVYLSPASPTVGGTE